VPDARIASRWRLPLVPRAWRVAFDFSIASARVSALGSRRAVGANPSVARCGLSAPWNATT
jgi:hypothetical protein